MGYIVFREGVKLYMWVRAGSRSVTCYRENTANLVLSDRDPVDVTFLYGNDTGYHAPSSQNNPLVAAAAPASQSRAHFDGSGRLMPAPVENVAESAESHKGTKCQMGGIEEDGG